jgi:hypothetical protein
MHLKHVSLLDSISVLSEVSVELSIAIDTDTNVLQHVIMVSLSQCYCWCSFVECSSGNH